jgi:hypothetical protein
MQVCRDASRKLINPPLSVSSHPPSLSTYSCNEHMSCKWNLHILLIATLEVKQFLLSSTSISLRAHAVATHLVRQSTPRSCYKTQISKAAVDFHLHLHLSDLMSAEWKLFLKSRCNSSSIPSWRQFDCYVGCQLSQQQQGQRWHLAAQWVSTDPLSFSCACCSLQLRICVASNGQVFPCSSERWRGRGYSQIACDLGVCVIFFQKFVYQFCCSCSIKNF